jgi:hypothetical protein
MVLENKKTLHVENLLKKTKKKKRNEKNLREWDKKEDTTKA